MSTSCKLMIEDADVKNWMKLATPFLTRAIFWLLAVTFFVLANCLLIADRTASAATLNYYQ